MMGVTIGVTDAARHILDVIDKGADGEYAESPVIIPGADRYGLAELFAAFGYVIGAEVGVESGRYSYELLTRNPGLRLLCVDAWRPYRGYREHVTKQKLEGLYDQARARLAGLNAQFIRNWSVEASKEIPDQSLDFVYLDANHDYKHVTEDLEAWAPKVRIGGMVSGHDYCGGRQRSGYVVEVVQAVKDYTSKHRIHPWYVLGVPELVPGTTRERPRDFLWVKEF